MSDKPIIIAICGKSATGKTTLAANLKEILSNKGIESNVLVSFTTRDKRANEQNGVDYYFVDKLGFLQLAVKKYFLEYTKFRNWYYGISRYSISLKKINIGVFDAKGLISLSKKQSDYIVVPIYLKEKLRIRLLRSKQRENKWRIEFFRRAFKDYLDFKDISFILRKFKYHLILSEIENNLDKSYVILKYLDNMKILVRK